MSDLKLPDPKVETEIDPSEIEVPVLEPAADLKAALTEVKRLDALHETATDRYKKRTLAVQLDTARKRFYDLQQVPEVKGPAISHGLGDPIRRVTAADVEAARAATTRRFGN